MNTLRIITLVSVSLVLFSSAPMCVGGDSPKSTLSENLKSSERQIGEWESINNTRKILGVGYRTRPDKAQEDTPKTGGGALVGEVYPGSAAEEAGLKAGDLIFQFDGKTVSDKRDLEKQLAQSPSGKKLPAKLIRNGQIKEVEIEIKSKEFPPLRRMVELGGVGQSLVIRDRSSSGIVYYDPETKNIVYVTVLPIGIVWKTVYSKEALDKDKYVGTMETTGIDGKKGTGQLHTEWMGKDEFSEWISFGNGDESLRITFQAG